MIVRRCWSLILLSTCLILYVRIDGISGERWSRQVSNSDWIPLANPRSASSQIRPSNSGNGATSSGSPSLPHLSSLSLPPALQEQYQQQLLQLQKTQENIQKLLILQEQLRTQQQLLQSQTFLPSGFSSPENDKRMLQQNTIPNLSGLSSDVLVPPLPSSDALPPIYSAQNFLTQGQQRFHPPIRGNQNLNVKSEEFGNSHNSKSQVDYSEGHEDGLREGQSLVQLTQVEDIRDNVKEFVEKQEKYRPTGKQVKGQTVQQSISGISENAENENEEVQLVYVPVETLAQQRVQPKRFRGQKQYPFRQQQQQQQQKQQQQYRINDEIEQTTREPDTFGRDFLDQLKFAKEERSKEVARIEDVEKALERKAQLEQEILQKEQELARQKEEERRRKELEKIEEIAKQRELERLREVREKQRLEELERRRIAEARAKEERRRQEEEKRRQEEEARQREKERLAALERQKQLEIQRALEEDRKLEQQRQEEASTIAPNVDQNQPDTQALSLTRNKQLHRQHLEETTHRIKHRNRVRQQRPRINQQPPTTTPPPSPNQPPLSVYMGGDSMAPDRVKIADVLRILKDAKTIAVLDTVVPNTPKVFVGPTNLDPPAGYTKFDLPYLSSIDHNRVERKVDKLPFFVAPLSFDPPPGYSKIPFPAPHIGSVVVNTIDASSPEPDTPEILHNPSPTPLIEPNSYIDGTGSNLGRIDPTTLSYEHSTTAGYTQELSSTPKYDSSYSTITNPGGSRFRFRQSYGENNPPSVIDTIYRGESSLPAGKSKQKAYYNEDSRPVAPTLAHETRLGTTATAYQEEAVYSSTPNYPEHSLRTLDDPSTKEQDLAAQLALINHELAQQRDANNNKNSFVERQNAYAQSDPHLINSFQPLLSQNDVNEVRESVGPTQYNLPAELPISPHLPGLVNSLLEKQTTIPTTTTTHVVTTPAYTKTTTTTTTVRPPSTTYRPRSRHRSRIVPTRPTTTTTPTTSITRTTVDRSRRPYSRTRSGSRYTTTTESYNDSTAYEPTKSKNSGTTEKYNYADHHKRARGQKHRNNDKTAYQSEAYDQNYNVQAHQAATYEHTAPDESITSSSTDPYSQSGSTSHNSNQQESNIPLSNLNAFSQENYPSTSISSTENYPPPRETTTNYNTPVASDDYSKSQNYPQNYPQEANYPIAYGSQLNDLDQSVLEKAPVNGFNYQAQNSETRNQPTVQKSKDYNTAYYAEKLENTDFGVSGTTSENQGSKIDKTAQQYSPVYDVAPVQSHLNYPPTGENANFGQVEDRKVDGSSVVADPNEEPIFIPLPPEKHQVYDLLTPSTEEPLNAMLTQISTTTEPTPVVIRQRVRGRVGTRTHSDSVVQTRPRGSQDEYVRFSAVNHQDSSRSSNAHRHRTKSRSRPQSQVKTSGYDYVKIQAGSQRQRPFVQQTTPSTTTIATTTTTTTTTTPRTTTTTTTEQPLEEDIDYGFIRPPSFRPVNPVDNRFHAPPVTFKPILPQVNNLPIQQQTSGSAQEIEIEYDPPPNHSLKNRPKYQTTNRRPLIKSTILPITTPITTTTTENIPQATLNPDNSVYTVRPKYKPEDIKQNRSRSRTRRPGGRKRVSTTSTTESGFDANNEVPLEGNYPRILPPHPAAIGEQQQTLYDENFGSLSQFGETYNQPDQNYKPATENYPPQDFALNFGAVSPQTQLQQDEYDQTQLASNSPQNYDDHSTHSKSRTSSDSQVMPADIYGAESQWSTKLSRTSFQPSFAANYATDGFNEARTKDGNVREVADIITVRPENSVTYVVSSELENSDETKSIMSEEESMIKATTVFGQKMMARDHTENPMKRQQKLTSYENDDEDDKWRSKEDNLSREPTDNVEDGEKIPKKTTDSVAVRKTNRRKRVRVRVRPIVDDFVTAESQHINAAVNSLTHDQYKYNPIRQTRPNLGEFSITKSTGEGSRRSMLQDFLEEMLKTDEVSVPVLATSTSTVLPLNVWQTSTPITSSIEEGEEEETTNYKFSRITTNIPTTISDELEGTLDPEESLRATTQYYGTRIYPKDSITKDTTESIKLQTIQETGTTSNDFNNSQTTLNDLNSIDTALETTPIPEKLETTTIKLSDTTIEEDSPIVESTKTEESRDNDNISYLKNHRAKWSEVRFPSDPSIALNHSLFSTWNYDQNGKTAADWSKTSTKDTTNKEEKDSEIKILSDYVETVFDDLKGSKENSKERSDEKSLEKNNKVGTMENSNEDNNVKTNSPLKAGTISVKKEISQVEDRSLTKLEKEETPTTIVVQNIDDSSFTSSYYSNPTVILDTTMHDILSKDESMVTVTPTSLITTTSTTTTTPTKPTIPTTSDISQRNTTETILGKILRTSTTTKVSHMTEICYRGRCVMTKPDREIRLR